MVNDFLKKLDNSQVLEIVETMYCQEYSEGSYIIREGEIGNHLFVSAEGEYHVIKSGNILGKMGPGESFGELAILYNCTRTASVKGIIIISIFIIIRIIFVILMKQNFLQL